MSVKDLTQGEFDYLRSYSDDMRSCHENEFVKYIDPPLMRAMYRGKTKYEKYERENYGQVHDDNEHLTALVTIFQAENTILPVTYWQNPQPIIRAIQNAIPESAALLTATIKKYMYLNNAKRQNQESVLNARFFGLGWKKIRFHSEYDESQSQESPQEDAGGMMGSIKSMLGMGQASKPKMLEARERPDIATREMLYNDAESPMNIALDHKADMLNCKAVLHSLPRTLEDLENSGAYEDDILEELSERMKSKHGMKFDSRRTEFRLRELHFWQRDGLYVLTHLEEYKKPLRYFRSDFEDKGFLFKFPFEPLSLTFEPGVRYPTSHLKVASQVQTKADALTTLFVELVARSVNLLVVNEKALATGQSSQLEKNLVRGILRMKEPITPGAIQSFSSGAVTSDLPQLIGLLQQKISEVLGGDQQLVLGKSTNETLGQDELARGGTKSREAGMRDRIRDWMIEQLRKETCLIQKNSNAPFSVNVTSKDYAIPTSQARPDVMAQFMNEQNPLGLKNYVGGEYEYDFNMDEAVRPDKQSMRQALVEMMNIASRPDVQDATLQSGFRFRIDKIAKGLASTLDNVINPDEYIEQLNSMQIAAIQTQKVMMASNGVIGGARSAGASKQNEKEKSEMAVSNPSSVEANG